MKKIKAVFCVMLVLALTLSLAGCSFGGGIRVGKDGNVIIKDKDGELVIGEKKWDKSKMHELDAPKAKLTTSLITDKGAMYGLDEMKEEDAKEYINAIKTTGFIYNSVTVGDYSYTGANEEGYIIIFTYDADTKSGTITSSKGDPPSEEDKDRETVLGGSDKKWDSSLMGGLPDPGAEVASFLSADGEVNYSFESFTAYRDYVEIIKEHGFTEDASEVDSDGYYMYAGTNSAGNRVILMASTDSCSITFKKAD